MPHYTKKKSEPSEGNERLRTLYAVLAGIPDNKIDLAFWRNCSYRLDDWEVDCGTTGCAFGWACVYPPFMDMGLRHDVCECPELFDQGQVYLGWSAVIRFFSLGGSHAQEIFGLSVRLPNERGLTGKQKVMRRIRRYLWLQGVITTRRNTQLSKIEGVPE